MRSSSVVNYSIVAASAMAYSVAVAELNEHQESDGFIENPAFMEFLLLNERMANDVELWEQMLDEAEQTLDSVALDTPIDLSNQAAHDQLSEQSIGRTSNQNQANDER